MGYHAVIDSILTDFVQISCIHHSHNILHEFEVGFSAIQGSQDGQQNGCHSMKFCFAGPMSVCDSSSVKMWD